MNEEHLFVIDGLFTESYKRLPYENIKALVYRDTKLGAIFIFCSVQLVAISTFLLLIPEDWVGPIMKPAYYIWGGMTALLGVPLLITSLIQGLTCNVRLDTTAQEVTLHCLRSRRKFRKYAPILRELIAKKQRPPINE
jgi:hypothetical protein